jgi:hypothetical protein
VKLGKHGKNNLLANKRLKKIFQEEGITSCEVNLKGCTGSFGLTFAHRHKRIFYHSNMHLLSDFNHVLVCCLNCHILLEVDKELTERVFKNIRGDER